MATPLKIVFMAGDKQIVIYGQGIKNMKEVDTHVFERLRDDEREKLANVAFRKYWIDDEKDPVDLITDSDFDFFLKRSLTQKTPKIYYEAKMSHKDIRERDERLAAANRKANLNVHMTVECDVCLQAPIRGFRYKCLQCDNFDLCMKCEKDMHHADHLMVRIPSSDSPSIESLLPVHIVGKAARRQQKYAARAAAAVAAAASAAESAPGEGKSRRHHRKHCTGGAGLLSNFYEMMQDLAEGGVPQPAAGTPQKQPQQATPEASSSPQEYQQVAAAAKAAAAQLEANTAAASAKAAAASAAAAAASATAASASATTPIANNNTKENNKSPNRSSPPATGGQTTPNGTMPSTPSLESLIDPQFMKAGIQILNNFSEMFGKILDPVVTETGSRSSSAPDSVVVDIDLTGEEGASVAPPPPTAAETPNKPGNSNAESGIVTPMETETSAPLKDVVPEASQPRSRNSQSEENDWTMIDNNSVVADAPLAAPAAAPSTAPPAAPTAPIDFVKLSQQLQSHIENEMKSVSFDIASSAVSVTPPQVVTPAQSSAPAPAPTPAPAVVAPTSNTTERRAVPVFHADPRINSAVQGMMAMGFSNEGAVLTQLLESVNGSIPLALDLMSAAQRN